MGGPSFGNTGAERSAPTTTTTTALHSISDSDGHEGGPPVAFADLAVPPPPLDHALVREVLDGRLDLPLFGGTEVSPPPIDRTVVKDAPIIAERLDQTILRPATTTPGAPATNRPTESSAFSKPEPPTQPQRWQDDAEGGTAVYRAPGTGAPGSGVGFRPPGTPILIDERGTTEAVMVDGGLVARIVGAYLSDDEDGRATIVPDCEPLDIGNRPESPFFDDPFVDRCHAALTSTPAGVRVEDFSEANGIYMRVQGPVPLVDGVSLIVGRQVLSFHLLPAPRGGRPRTLGCPNPGWWGRLDAMAGPDVHLASFPLLDTEVVVGSERGAGIRFDASSGVAAAHCRIRRETCGGVVVEDLGSTPGTFIRVRSGTVVPHDCELLIGRTLMRLERLRPD